MPKETFYNLPEEKKQRIIDAAFRECENYSYEEVKLSRIIKDSKIPRGSFYQYFEDKRDLYIYVFHLIQEKKMEYMKDLLPNPENTSFVELFLDLYTRGVAFAEENPGAVRIGRNLFVKKGPLYDELIKDGLQQARMYYVSYLEADKSYGRIRQDVDIEMLADFVINVTTTIAFDELVDKDTLDAEKLIKRVKSMIQILQKGIE